LTSAARTNGPNGAADAAYRFAYQYDEVGNRLHEDRGLLDLDGGFNNLNQLTARRFSGRLDMAGTATTTNPPVTVKVDGQPATLFDGTNYWGGARVAPGSNVASIVALDAASNRTTALRPFQMPPANPEVFQYDLNGNLTNDGQRACFWDEENRLVAVEGSAPSNPRLRSEYLYDAQGRRIQKADLSGWTGCAYAATNVTRFVWDGWLLLAELDEDNSVTAYHVHGLDLSQTLQGAGGIGGLLARIEAGASSLYTFDGNGNITDVLGENATVVAHYEYDPFGRTISQNGSYATVNPWRFSTKQFDDRWGVYYYGLRFYSPALGRWISRDPIEVMKGQNLQRFVGNSPVCATDPFGLYTLLLPPWWSENKIQQVENTFSAQYGILDHANGLIGQRLALLVLQPKKCPFKIPLIQQYIAARARVQSIRADLDDSSQHIHIWNMTSPGSDGTTTETGFGSWIIGLSNLSASSQVLHELSHHYGTSDATSPMTLDSAHYFDDFAVGGAATLILSNQRQSRPMEVKAAVHWRLATSEWL
jgi:RHS repeat-associated protein